MEGTPVLNKQNTRCPLKVALADGRQVLSRDDSSTPQIYIGPIGHGLNYIVEDDDSSIGNIFCFEAFADK
jgi:hypothetical protein